MSAVTDSRVRLRERAGNPERSLSLWRPDHPLAKRIVRSTENLRPAARGSEWARQDSNLGTSGYEPGALTD